VHPTLHVPTAGKQVGLSLAAAGDTRPKVSRLLIMDKTTDVRYLIDTGSDVSVYPPRKHRQFKGKIEYQLYAANGSIIPTYGTVMLKPDLGLRREFPWRFADVLQPIGADFLAHYYLLPDMKKKKLIDGRTGLYIKGVITVGTMQSVKTVIEQTPYHRILAQFPEITTLSGTRKQRVQTLHYQDYNRTAGGMPTEKTCQKCTKQQRQNLVNY